MEDTHVTLRQATLDDLPAMMALFVRTIRSACRMDYTPVEIEAWAASVLDAPRWTGKMARQHVLVAEVTGTLVGFASLDGADYLDLLYVHADYLRKGIARRLCHAIEQEALRRGATTLRLDASVTAKPFFMNSGYTVLADRLVSLRGVELRQFQMTKSLSPDSEAVA